MIYRQASTSPYEIPGTDSTEWTDNLLVPQDGIDVVTIASY